jgi:histidine triad (HIT) family protein
MALTEEEIKQVKEQLLKQIESFPDDKKKVAKEQILAMNAEQLEEFLEKNKLIKQKGGEGECIFCSIAKGETPSYKIDENREAVAVLDINPVSKGHSMVVPKKHATIEKLSSSVLSLAKKIARKIKNKFKAEEVKLETAAPQGHGIINIIPFYKDQKPERKKAEEKELLEIQKKLKKRTRASRPRKPKKPKTLPKAPVRIP